MTRTYNAGIYIADDFVISELCEAGRQANNPATLKPDEHMVSASLAMDLDDALGRLAEKVGKDDTFRAVAVALPGPILGSGQVDPEAADYGKLGTHRRGPRWSGLDTRQELTAAIQAHAKFRSAASSIYHDAAAYAFGEYSSHWDKVADRQAHAKFRRDQIFAHTLVDSGIGCAIVARGDIAQGRMHSEAGHIPVRPHPRDANFVPDCGLHAQFGCLESYISLEALQRRWGPGVVGELERTPPSDERLSIIGYYLSQLCINLILTIAPTHFGFSGRTMRNPAIVSWTKRHTNEWLKSSISGLTYPGYSEQRSGLPFEVVPRHAGVYGALRLAMKLSQTQNVRPIRPAP
jgi:predicted NBD/HSP70 family sugar kinase